MGAEDMWALAERFGEGGFILLLERFGRIIVGRTGEFLGIRLCVSMVYCVFELRKRIRFMH